MKQAGSDTHILEVEGSTPFGVYLAADYTAEHESGIAGILSLLGIDRDGRFFDGRCATRPVEHYKLVENQVTNQYYSEDRKRSPKIVEKPLTLYLEMGFGVGKKYASYLTNRYRQETEVTGAWDDREFAITGWTDKGRAIVRLLHEGLLGGDIAVWTGGAGGNPFARNGLVIVRKSLVPAELIAKLNDSDQQQLDLEAAANATGIFKRLEAINERPHNAPLFYEKPRGWHALSPRIITADEQKERGTKHNVMFFLNPANQTKYQHGWYTVEELDDWIADKGKVLEEAKLAAAAKLARA